MGPVDLLSMEPQVVFLGQLSGELIVLPVIPAHINGVAVCGDEAHGLGGGLLHLPPASLQPEVTAGGQLLPDFLQLALRLRPVQLLQDAEEVLHEQWQQCEAFFCIFPTQPDRKSVV